MARTPALATTTRIVKSEGAEGLWLRTYHSGIDDKAHWQAIHGDWTASEASWSESVPTASLALIDAAGLDPDAAILDVGGGASVLGGHLLRRGYSNITVADISAAALGQAQAELGAAASRITWVEADVRQYDFGQRFDLWHDRALLHFMVEPADRDAYVETLTRTLRPGGHLILATFGPDQRGRWAQLGRAQGPGAADRAGDRSRRSQPRRCFGNRLACLRGRRSQLASVRGPGRAPCLD